MWGLLFLLFFVFMITYDPKSGTLNKYIPNSPEEKKENAPCKHGHFNEIQFAQQGYECPSNDKTNMGAIIST